LSIVEKLSNEFATLHVKTHEKFVEQRNDSALTPDPSPTLRERGVFREKSAGSGSPLSRSVGEGLGVRAA
jgi:hypothetical protein